MKAHHDRKLLCHRGKQRHRLELGPSAAKSALVKSRQGQAPLWALMLAAAGLDIVFVPLAGVATIEPIVGARDTSGTAMIGATLLLALDFGDVGG